MNHPTPMPYAEPSPKWTLHHDTLFPHTYLLLSGYLVIPCSLVSLHLYCTHCSFLVTLYTFSRYLHSLSCTHYLILDITNASLALFLCFLSVVTISWLSLAFSYSPVWLSLSLPALVEPCSCFITNLDPIKFVISLMFDPLTSQPLSVSISYLASTLPFQQPLIHPILFRIHPATLISLFTNPTHSHAVANSCVVGSQTGPLQYAQKDNTTTK